MKSSMCHSMGDSAISANPMRCTGIDRSSNAASACLPHRSVVEMMIRFVNGFLPEAVKNESISDLARVEVGS